MRDPATVLLAQVLGLFPDNIDDDLVMRETESWDSLKHIELITAIETTFHIQLTLTEIVSMTSLRGIRRVLIEKGVTG